MKYNKRVLSLLDWNQFQLCRLDDCLGTYDYFYSRFFEGRGMKRHEIRNEVLLVLDQVLSETEI